MVECDYDGSMPNAVCEVEWNTNSMSCMHVDIVLHLLDNGLIEEGYIDRVNSDKRPKGFASYPAAHRQDWWQCMMLSVRVFATYVQSSNVDADGHARREIVDHLAYLERQLHEFVKRRFGLCGFWQSDFDAYLCDV